MPSPDFNGRIFLCRDQMEASLLFILELVAETLEQDVGFIGFGNGHHLHVLVLELDHFGEGKLADLTLEFGEVVRRRDSFDLLFHFAVNPRLQASHMYQLAAALAVTGRNQGIFDGFLAAQAHFAVELLCAGLSIDFMFADLKDAVGFLEVIGIAESKRFLLVFRLDHHILHPAEFDNVSGF